MSESEVSHGSAGAQATTLVNIRTEIPRLQSMRSTQASCMCNLTDREIMTFLFSDEAKIAKRKLRMLSNHVFEELTVDVYDEVDRRETDVIWNALHGSKVRN